MENESNPYSASANSGQTSSPSTNASEANGPRRVLTLFDCTCIIVGTIIGAGIFKMPAVVASNCPSLTWLIVVWVFGGMVALIGALCFAELTTTYPDQGGDYGYLKRAYHPRIGFAFSWAAFWVIRPGNIGAMAMIFGEFASRVFPGVPLVGFAIAVVVVMTATNLIGITFGKTTQNVLTVAKVIGILLIVAGAFLFWPNPESAVEAPAVQNAASQAVAEAITPSDPVAEDAAAEDDSWGWFWLSMVFVMFTFGGWNDIAFVATEAKKPKRNLLWALIFGTVTVLLIYLLVNFALVVGLGFDRMAELGSQWQNATSVLVEQNMGSMGARLFAIIVCISCLGAINGMIFTSPRIYWATAKDYPQLRWLTGGSEQRGWWPAMLLQAIVTVAFIAAFGLRGGGFENMAAANAPYFWMFLALTVIAIIVLRSKSKGQFDGYRVPLYPVLPIFFAAACVFMIYRGLLYMFEQDLEIQAIVIGAWVFLGFVLSVILEKKSSS